MTDIALSPRASGSTWCVSPAMDALYAHAAEAGNHQLLHRIRSGVAHAEEVSAWAQSRLYLAEYLARKETLVLTNAVDRETRRLWTSRLQVIDGHGDFYGPSKQGLIESWRRLLAHLCSSTTQLSTELAAAIARLLEAHLLCVHEATWIETLGMAVVDDWVVRNDGTTTLMLAGVGTIPGTHHMDWALQSKTDIAQNTLKALSVQLAQPAESELASRVLQSIERRVGLEQAILDAAQASSAHGQC